MLIKFFKKNLMDISIIFFSIIPVWFFQSKNFLDIHVLIFFVCIIFFIVLLNEFLKKKYLNLNLFLLSVIIFYGLDSKIGFLYFFDYILKSNSQLINYIVPTIFLLLSISLIFIFLKKNELSKKVFLSSILFIFIYSSSIFFFKIQSYEFENIKLKLHDSKKNEINKVIIIQLDELINIDFIDENIPFSKEAKKSTLELFQKYKFKLYSSAYSIYDNTQYALPGLLNFDYNTEKNNLRDGTSYTWEDEETLYKINKNTFFEQNKEKKIITTKALVNLCDNDNVNKCLYSNSINNYKKYLGSFEFSSLDYIVKKTHEQKSLLFQYFWRAGKKINLFDYYHPHLFYKLNFENQLKNTSYLIKNSNYELYYLHFFFPHNPWGLEIAQKPNECKFSEELYRKDWWSKDEKLIEQHYKEIICTNFYLDTFLQDLKENKNFENYKILILSDHGLPLYQYDEEKLLEYNQKTAKNRHGVLFAIKDKDKFKIDNQLVSSQELFSKYFNKHHIKEKKNKDKKIFNVYTDKFIKIER